MHRAHHVLHRFASPSRPLLKNLSNTVLAPSTSSRLARTISGGSWRNNNNARSQSVGAAQKRDNYNVHQQRAVSQLAAEPFMNGTSSVYIEEMYKAWRSDPNSVHKSWDVYFRGVEGGAQPGQAYQSPPTIVHHGGLPAASFSQAGATGLASAGVDEKSINDHLSVSLLIRNYQARGHKIADLDPLGIDSADLDTSMPPELTLEHYGLTDADLDRQFSLPRSTHIGGDEKTLTLREILNRLKSTYCHHIGVEYMHIANRAQKDWLRMQFEYPHAMEKTPEEKKVLFKRLIRSTKFEEFLAKKWPSEKRFGLEGCEVLIPAIKQIIDRSSEAGVERFVIGMPHRGRLNVLANVTRQPLPNLFSQFSTLEPSDEGSGDVKYHLGVCIDRFNRQTQKNTRIAVCANPSHLEAVNPVVAGKAKAEMFYSGDETGDRTLAITMHGDAAFSGQGVVFETLHLSALPSYCIHGNIHLIVNNQVGFTTDPRVARASPYCTDVGRVVGAPIFHVNGDNPEAVMHACDVASRWREKFRRDVVIDIVCYRRHGHNELDEPMFTQPIMYQKIKTHQNTLEQYKAKILAEGAANEQYVKDELAKYGQILEDAYADAGKITSVRNRDWLDSPWDDFFVTKDPLKIPDTGLSTDVIQHIGSKFSSVEEGFNLHRGLKRILDGRAKMVNEEKVADWALGEAFAIGSLLKEGNHVRLSGQDVERGTFSHRHHVLHDQKEDRKLYNSLQHLYPDQAPYTVCNSSLSEYGILGFELGYSMCNPNSLCIWEAQFGDFSNTAQCIIDQFISSGESKWIRQSGLVMLLPHGYEGMGPEHSSARPERFLQMCNDDAAHVIPEGPTFEAQQLHDANWIVANCTTPSNICHLLRRQVAMPFRKPLIVMTPKSLLRHPEARSPLSEFETGTRFQRLIPEDGPATSDPSAVKRLVFCTGKVFYDVRKARSQIGMNDTMAISRVEQISPFPYDLIREECRKYPNAEIVWAQEEHKNMGAWDYVQPRFNTLFQGERGIKYGGRAPAAAPATGNKFQHIQEQKKVMADVMGVHVGEMVEAMKNG